MTTDSSLRELFESASFLPPDQRAGFVAGCSADPAVRARVARLLAAQETGSGILQMPAVLLAEKLAPAPASDWIGREIGGVRLCELLGQGGSAAVFRGEKQQDGVTLTVAVKLLRQALLTAVEVRRFRQERLAMARLAHPHIARLVDGGTTATGMAYIVLEYVDGLRITDYVQAQALEQRERLRLMVDVCHAVEAAHRALIVHRDLKPSNVLVTREGHVKLLDFGIAKFLGGEDATETGAVAMTPAYAAPEQRRGEAVTTAADIYALGLLLAEVLTGVNPAAEALAPSLTLAADGAHAAAQPPRLSTGALQGDVGAIVRKATAAEAAQRYASALALAEDIERFLQSRPVLAQPPSRLYRLRKFHARHRLLVAVSAVLCGLVVAAAAAALWQARIAVEQAGRASTEAALARATRDFLVDTFRQAEPAGPRAAPATVIDVTEAALVRIDADTRLDPRVRLDLKSQLGAVLRGQGRSARALSVLQQAYAQGAAAFGAADAMVVDTGLEQVRASLGADDYDAAARLLAMLAAAVAVHPGERQAEYEILASKVAATRGQAEAATAHVARATAACAGRCSDAVRFDLLVAEGNVNGVFQRNEAAAAAWEQAAALARRLHGPAHVSVSTALNGLAGAYRRLGRLQEAKRTIQEVIDIDDRIQLPALHWRRAVHLNQLGNVHFSLGEYAPALDALERGLQIARAVNGEDNKALAADLQSIAVVHSKLGQLERAAVYLGEALRRHAALSGEHGRDAALARANLAHVLAMDGRLDAALPLMEQAVQDLRAAGDGSQAWLFGALRTQARVLVWAGRMEQAVAVADEALALAERKPGLASATQLAAAHVARGLALARSGAAAQATPVLQQALQQLQAAQGDFHAQAQAGFALGLAAVQQQDCAGAAAQLAQARAALRREPFTYAYLATAESALAAALRRGCPR